MPAACTPAVESNFTSEFFKEVVRKRNATFDDDYYDNHYDSAHPRARLPDSIDSDTPFLNADYNMDYAASAG